VRVKKNPGKTKRGFKKKGRKKRRLCG